ncbi:MAG: rhamnulokinase [Clostridiales bacterium]|nr:rhamnulokinase [Clostridiales bacterium]
MNTYYLAVDIGASSGRHILGWMENGKMQLEEVYRFSNGMVKKDGELCWEVDRLYGEIIAGMKKCRELGKIPVSMGVDTWGVDFVLLDENDRMLGNAVGYRDKRNNGMDEKVYEKISQEDLYARTGIQKAVFNTIYQLMAVKQNHPEYMEAAKTLLFVPDYFHFRLTGKKVNEYTEATTGQLISPVTKKWDYELIELLGYNKEMFREVVVPGTNLGGLTEEVQREVGFNLDVVVPATHDTGSAVLAVPANDDDFIYISSGTWSLMGIERMEADCSKRSSDLNLTNEGGYDYRFRYLKNIMGLWMIQSVRHEYDDAYNFGEICAMAEEAKDFPSRVDVNDNRFLAPENMTEEVKAACRESGQPVPETLGELATVIYASLAECYAATAKELEEMAGRTFGRIHIVGGGANASYLNELTAKATKKEVHAGPTEATAIGNLTAQMLRAGEFSKVEEARDVIHESFNIKITGGNKR